ncbi:MAG: hypothetical protein AB7P49_15060, partial [Bdellovibrionales bacterium]
MWRKQTGLLLLFFCGALVVFGTGNPGLFFTGLTAQEKLAEDNSPRRQKDSVGPDDRQGDRQVIGELSIAFVKAFNDGDAKAVASFWTENGEYHNEQGEFIQGR